MTCPFIRNLPSLHFPQHFTTYSCTQGSSHLYRAQHSLPLLKTLDMQTTAVKHRRMGVFCIGGFLKSRHLLKMKVDKEDQGVKGISLILLNYTVTSSQYSLAL